MQEEIFRARPAIVTVPNVDEAIAFINCRERPLLCTSSWCVGVLERTSSGGFGANDTIMQMTLISLPFGGIGTIYLHNPMLTDSYYIAFFINLFLYQLLHYLVQD
uniref:Uncharacterized protein n=1 Tax=Chelonoidis abingdonii TaxID=106734 RepID=A0A8C0J740_CHEAB